MTGVIEWQGQWFCSEPCVKEFERRRAAARTGGDAGTRCPMPGRLPWYLDAWIWVPLSGLLLIALGRWWPPARAAGRIYLDYVRMALVPLLVGLLLGGLIDRFVPKTYIIKLLSGPRKRVIARATLLGFLASTCSHGCLALSIELYRKGASVPAVVSFLLASPWASMSLTFILLGFFGLKGLVFVVGALLIAFVTGLTFQRLARRGLIEANPQTIPLESGLSIWEDVTLRWRRYEWTPRALLQDTKGVITGAIPLGRMTLGWVQLGFLLSALIGAGVPHVIFHRFLGPTLGGLLLTLLAAAIIEVCSEGTAPLAFELYRQTGALGNAFAFLMGGVVTDYTELGALWAAIGPRTVGWILLITLPLVTTIGWILNRWGG